MFLHFSVCPATTSTPVSSHSRVQLCFLSLAHTDSLHTHTHPHTHAHTSLQLSSVLNLEFNCVFPLQNSARSFSQTKGGKTMIQTGPEIPLSPPLPLLPPPGSLIPFHVSRAGSRGDSERFDSQCQRFLHVGTLKVLNELGDHRGGGGWVSPPPNPRICLLPHPL